MDFLFNLILLFSIDNNVTVFYSFQINVIFFYQNVYFVHTLCFFKHSIQKAFPLPNIIPVFLSIATLSFMENILTPLMILSSTQNLCAQLYCVNMCRQQCCLYMYFSFRSVRILFRTPSLQLDCKLQIEESYLQFKVSLFPFSCLTSCYLFQYSKTFDFSVY